MTADELVAAAREAMTRAHAPYSNFPVGAALLASSDKVYTGTNVENASFGLSICAERSAIFAAAGAGEREFKALAVATKTAKPTYPCGACRQVMREFSVDLPVYLAGQAGDHQETTLAELLPSAFGPAETALKTRRSG